MFALKIHIFKDLSTFSRLSKIADLQACSTAPSAPILSFYICCFSIAISQLQYKMIPGLNGSTSLAGNRQSRRKETRRDFYSCICFTENKVRNNFRITHIFLRLRLGIGLGFGTVLLRLRLGIRLGLTVQAQFTEVYKDIKDLNGK